MEIFIQQSFLQGILPEIDFRNATRLLQDLREWTNFPSITMFGKRWADFWHLFCSNASSLEVTSFPF